MGLKGGYVVKISIIIPVYNAGKYIEQCINSIINQNLYEIEAIFVDDGSTDNSLNILNTYAQKDNRIVIISQKNSGVSVARNSGLEVAQGEYIMFIDSDDWLESNCLLQIYNAIKDKNLDILAFRHVCCLDNKRRSGNFFDLKNYSTNTDMFKIIPFLFVIWNKIYKREFLKKNNIAFPKDLKYAEDGVFNLECLYAQPKFSIDYTLGYNYRCLREGAATTNIKTIDAEIKTFLYSFNSIKFKETSVTNKIITIEKYIKGILMWYKEILLKCGKFRKARESKKLFYLYKFLNKNVESNILHQCYSYHDLCKILDKNYCCKNICIKNKYADFHNVKYKILNFLGFKITFFKYQKNGFTTEWSMKFLGIEILKSKIKNIFKNSETIYFFGIPIYKNNIRKRQQKRYMECLSKLHKNYDAYYCMACNCGELFWFLCHYHEIASRYDFKKPAIVVDKARMKSVFKIFKDLIPIDCVLYEDCTCLFLDREMKYNNKTFISPFNDKYFNDYADVNICKNGKHYYELLKDSLQIKKSAIIPTAISNDNSYIETIAKVVLKNNFIILTPEAVSLNQLPEQFWIKLCKELKKLGYELFLNATHISNRIDGVFTCFLSIDEINELAKYSKGIIGLRSGLLEILSSTSSKPTIVIYNSYIDTLPNKMSPQEAKTGFSIKKLPNISNNVQEYCVDEYIVDELIYEIIEYIKKTKEKVDNI